MLTFSLSPQCNEHAYSISIHATRIVFLLFYKSMLFIVALFLFVIRCDYERFIFYFLLGHNLQPVMDSEIHIEKERGIFLAEKESF